MGFGKLKAKSVVAVIAMSVGLLVSAPVQGQDAQTLADIRQEAAVLSVELSKLKRELSTTSAPNTQITGASSLERVDLMETTLSRLTAKMEELEYRIERIVADGTNQLDDLNFRLCELEPGCDIGNLPPLDPIGGAPAGASDVVVVGNTLGPDLSSDGADQLAEAEQSDFDAAMGAYESGAYDVAAASFGAFAQTYTGGHLTGEAHYLRGESLTRLGQISDAARAYLDSFNDDTDGEQAPGALLRLGTSMIALGHMEKGCVMLSEVGARFPGAPEAFDADQSRQMLGCQ